MGNGESTFSPKDLDALHKKYDKNGDGSLGMDEFISLGQEVAEAEGVTKQIDTKKLVKVFTALDKPDKNGKRNGTISKAEFLGAYSLLKQQLETAKAEKDGVPVPKAAAPKAGAKAKAPPPGVKAKAKAPPGAIPKTVVGKSVAKPKGPPPTAKGKPKPKPSPKQRPVVVKAQAPAAPEETPGAVDKSESAGDEVQEEPEPVTEPVTEPATEETVAGEGEKKEGAETSETAAEAVDPVEDKAPEASKVEQNPDPPQEGGFFTGWLGGGAAETTEAAAPAASSGGGFFSAFTGGGGDDDPETRRPAGTAERWAIPRIPVEVPLGMDPAVAELAPRDHVEYIEQEGSWSLQLRSDDIVKAGEKSRTRNKPKASKSSPNAGFRSVAVLEEMSDPDSEKSADSISGMVKHQWKQEERHQRYLYPRDKAVAFSKPWAVREWSVQMVAAPKSAAQKGSPGGPLSSKTAISPQSSSSGLGLLEESIAPLPALNFDEPPDFSDPKIASELRRTALKQLFQDFRSPRSPKLAIPGASPSSASASPSSPPPAWAAYLNGRRAGETWL